MLDFLKRIFSQQDEEAPYERMEPLGRIGESAIDLHSGSATEAYYETMGLLTNAISGRNYDNAASLVSQSLSHIPGWFKKPAKSSERLT